MEETKVTEKALGPEGIEKALESESIEKALETEGIEQALESEGTEKALKPEGIKEALESESTEKGWESESTEKAWESEGTENAWEPKGTENDQADVSNTGSTPAVAEYVPRNAEAAEEARKQGWVAPQPYDYEKYENKDAAAGEWAGVAARYEWKDEYGEVGPRDPQLENELFHGEFTTRVGRRFEELNAAEVTCESQHDMTAISSWADAGLHPVMLENIELCMYAQPTAIQCYAIPAILQGRDLIAIAQTGSGKTAAFFIPILSKLMGKARKWAAPRPEVTEDYDNRRDGVVGEPLVLVVCPTRELATQIFDEARRLCYRSMLRPCVVYGGAPTRLQREELRKGCDILIGTPGRILDFMGQPNVLSLKRVKFTVVDEADELLHEDWEADFKRVMCGGDVNEDDDHQYMMFSATFNRECRAVARKYLGMEHVRVRVGRPGSSHLNVQHVVVYVEQNRKKEALLDLLKSMLPVRTLVFVNSKQEVDYVDDHLYHHGFPSTSIHGDRTQREREDAIRAFRTAKCPIMIATSVSARGLDIVNVMHVINFDLPRASLGGINEYIHRIGRTARIGNEGIATSFYNEERDSELAPSLVKILLECKKPVPEFLEQYRPAADNLTFDEDITDDEKESDGNESKWQQESAEENATAEDATADEKVPECPSTPPNRELPVTPPVEASPSTAVEETSATEPGKESEWHTSADEAGWHDYPPSAPTDDNEGW